LKAKYAMTHGDAIPLLKRQLPLTSVKKTCHGLKQTATSITMTGRAISKCLKKTGP
jgi:hypothetical protein